jgi:hypothetical protein
MTPRLIRIILFAWALAVVAGLVLCVLILLLISRPEPISITKGSVHFSRVRWNSHEAIVITGNYPNFLGQIQGIGVRQIGRRFYLDQYVIRWHPLSRVSTHRDWPVVIELDDLPRGDYEVLYWTRDEGYVSAGEFKVPSRSAAAGTTKPRRSAVRSGAVP